MTEVSLAGRASFSFGPSSLELLTKKLEGGLPRAMGWGCRWGSNEGVEEEEEEEMNVRGESDVKDVVEEES